MWMYHICQIYILRTKLGMLGQHQRHMRYTSYDIINLFSCFLRTQRYAGIVIPDAAQKTRRCNMGNCCINEGPALRTLIQYLANTRLAHCVICPKIALANDEPFLVRIILVVVTNGRMCRNRTLLKSR